MLKRATIIAAACATCLGLGPVPALAAEEIVPLVTSGDWLVAAHSPSQVSAPDVCLAMNVAQKVGLRASHRVVEFRVVNETWALPPGTEGNIFVSSGDYSITLAINWNTWDAVSAPVAGDDLPALFSAMDSGKTMSVTVGKAAPILVSLSGSARATNAFMACAGIKSSAAGPGSTRPPGSNPFE